jgi:HSP20 family protein
MNKTIPTTWRSGVWPAWRDDPFEGRLGRLFEPFAAAEGLPWAPSVDVEETEDELTLTAELAGMDGDDVDIEIENHVLTLSGEKGQVRTSEGDEGTLRVWERRYGRFSRSFTLPNTIDTENVKAEFDRGVLTVHMPKTKESRGRRIAIKAR